MSSRSHIQMNCIRLIEDDVYSSHFSCYFEQECISQYLASRSDSQHLSKLAQQAIKRHGQQQKVLHVMRSHRHYTSGLLKPDYRVTAKQSRTSLFVVNEYVKHTSSYDQHNHLCLAASQKLKKHFGREASNYVSKLRGDQPTTKL